MLVEPAVEATVCGVAAATPTVVSIVESAKILSWFAPKRRAVARSMRAQIRFEESFTSA
jgi:hypothetical protein